MSAASSLLSTATAVSRSAAGFMAKTVKGFQVLRIDGYSLTKMIPGGANISSTFSVGNRHWHVDYYPNGADKSKDYSDYISLYLRADGGYKDDVVDRVQAQYKFSLLDAAGNPAYEHPAQTDIFTYSSELHGLGCGHGEFISREELERRRESLHKNDCLAIRCDVGFVQLEQLQLGHKYYYYNNIDSATPPPPYGHFDRSDYESDDDEMPRRRRNRRRQPDDKEYIRRFLAEQRRRK